jgi:hypothetical protein
METFRTDIDMHQLDVLMRESPAKYKGAVRKYLDDAGFEYKKQAALSIDSLKTVRDKSFVSSRLRVDKTADVSPNKMETTAGSIISDRFTGWSEDYGSAPQGRGSRILGTTARGGSMQSKVKAKNRIMPDIDIPKASDFSDIKGTPGQRIMAMISLIARHPSITQASNGMFILGGPFRPGVYRIKPGAIAKIRSSAIQAKGSAFWWYTYAPAVQRIQTFDKNVKFKKVDWSGDAMHNAAAQIEHNLTEYLKRYWIRKLSK